MKGKTWELPPGMVFGTYYCTRCGETLEREKVHRVVTPEDKDYYSYQGYGTYPERDHDVYSYQFACPRCGKRVAYREQRILARIQRKEGLRTLTESEIQANYDACKAAENKRALMVEIADSIFLLLVVLLGGYAAYSEGRFQSFIPAAALLLLWIAIRIPYGIAKHKGKLTSREFYRHSYEKKAQMERLHAYCMGNRELIARANRCYCFYCKAEMDKSEIVDYLEQENTAICPKCGVDAILPDSVREPINKTLLTQLHDYWF